jgi:hypothetical protein
MALFPAGLFYFWEPMTYLKKLLFLFALGLTCQAASAQPVAPKQDVLTLKETKYDFGTVPQGKPVFHFFEVVNTGSTPLKIDNIVTSCGCTTPEWSKEPIAPGGTAKIKVGYNAASEGGFEKSITVQYNGSETKQIIIKGNVWKAPAGAAPANASIQFLKQQIQ